MQIPDLFEEHRARHDMAFVANQILQNLELAGQQFDDAAVAVCGARHKIELKVADAQDGFLHYRGAPSRQRLDAGEQLGKGERLDEIIVAARAQAPHPIVDLAERADNERRRGNPCFAQAPNDGEAIHRRQHAVDGHDRVARRTRQTKALVAAGREIDLVAARFEKIDNLLGGLSVVFNDQNATSRTRHVFCISKRQSPNVAQWRIGKTNFCVRN